MAFRRPKFASWVTLSAFVLLAFGLGLTVFSTQQQQDNRSRASTVPNPNECNTQYGNASNPRCCSKSFTGGMCKYTYEACPGGFIEQTSSYTSWYCPGGNDYRCCKNAAPSANAGSDKTITLPTNSVTLSGSCSDADSDSRNLKSCQWTKETNLAGTIESPSSGSTKVSGLVQGTYTFKLTASDGYLNATDTVTVTVKAAAAPPAPKNTTFRLNLMIHGIGDGKFEGEDPDVAWGGKPPASGKLERDVKVEVYEIVQGSGLGAKVGEGTGKVKYENGGYKSVAPIDVGTGLTKTNYNIRIISGPAIRTEPRTITLGQENTITMTLKNGDANQDRNLNISDYSLIYNCVRDEISGKIPTTTQCSNQNKAKADIDDDGEVTWFDYNLVVRELTNQAL